VSSKWWGDGRRKKGEEKTTSTKPPNPKDVKFPKPFPPLAGGISRVSERVLGIIEA